MKTDLRPPATIRPSECERLWNCPGSKKLSENAPPQFTSKYAAEGTIAHKVAANWLSNTHSINVGNRFLQDDFDIEVTQEMAEHVMTYVAFVRNLVQQWKGCEIFIEHPIEVRSDLYGTTDCAIVVPYNKLYVIDFKYGAGIKVSAKENKQLMYYGLGTLLSLTQEDRMDIPMVELIIVQPRALGTPVETYSLSSSDLIKWGTELTVRATNILLEAVELNAGDWCKFCPAQPICPALKAQVTELTKLAFTEGEVPELPKPDKVPLGFMLQVLDKAPMIREWLKTFETYALNFAQGSNGNKQAIAEAGWNLEANYGHRKWKDEKEAYKVLSKLVKPDLLYTRKFASVSEAEKLLKKNKKLSDININELVSKSFNGYSLAKKDPDLINTVQAAFSDVD